MAATSTTVIVPGRSNISGIPGVKTEAEIRAMYGSELNLSSLQATEYDEGSVHFVEFKPRTGTKG